MHGDGFNRELNDPRKKVLQIREIGHHEGMHCPKRKSRTADARGKSRDLPKQASRLFALRACHARHNGRGGIQVFSVLLHCERYISLN